MRGAAEGIEQAGLAVVEVTQQSHYWCRNDRMSGIQHIPVDAIEYFSRVHNLSVGSQLLSIIPDTLMMQNYAFGGVELVPQLVVLVVVACAVLDA
jgi:hypothetical protein